MARVDFDETLDLAGGEIAEAVCELRAALTAGLPDPHARWSRSAVRHLEAAQLDLFQAKNDPWGSRLGRGPERQLHLL